jgi:hypothetical protein
VNIKEIESGEAALMRAESGRRRLPEGGDRKGEREDESETFFILDVLLFVFQFIFCIFEGHRGSVF